MVLGFIGEIFVFIWDVFTTILTISWSFIVTLVDALFGLFRIN